MELKLENNLAHQTMPVDGVATVVEASIQEPAKQSHQNPLLKRQLNSLPYHRILDIKMETGTGKTYVYTRTMFELHKR